MLYAVACVRNEEYYLPTFLEHIRDYVDGFVFLDDGSTDRTIEILEKEPKTVKIIRNPVTNELNWDEPGNRIKLLQETYDLSPEKDNTWVLCCDPDERFETAFLKKLREYTEEYKEKCYGVHFREIHNSICHYRSDGIWDQKNKFILFPLKENMCFDEVYVNRHHINWFYNDLQTCLEMTDYNLYHLKMLKADDRQKRVELYNAIDPEKKMQSIGYDYLTDEENMVLTKIPYLKRYDYRFLPEDIKTYNVTDSVQNGRSILFTLLAADGFHGSVMHVYELGSYFAKKGFTVICATIYYTEEIKNLLASSGIELIDITHIPEKEYFDVIYGLHYPLYGYLFNKRVTCNKLVMSCLAKVLSIEFFPIYWQKASILLTVSEEAKQIQAERFGIPQERITVLENLIPEKFADFKFEKTKKDIHTSPLSIVVVSNQTPNELMELTQYQDLSVTFYGMGQSHYQAITPEILAQFDIIISIGKTVQYALGMGIPVYEYDHYGGEGYIDEDNFSSEIKYNFSGRSTYRQLSSKQIHDELVSGYEKAYENSEKLRSLALSRLYQPTRLDALLQAIDNAPAFDNDFSNDPVVSAFLVCNKDFLEYEYSARMIIQSLNNHNNNLNNENNRLSAERDRIIAEMNTTYTNYQQLQTSYNEISNAFFWKITKPLRSLADFLKRLLKR